MKTDNIKKVEDILINIFPIFFKRKNKIGIFSLCIYRIKSKNSKKNMDKYIVINEKKEQVKMLFKKGIILLKLKGYSYYLNIYKVTFDMEHLMTCPIQNRIKMTFEKDEQSVEMPVIYSLIYFNRNFGKTSRIYTFKENKVVIIDEKNNG